MALVLYPWSGVDPEKREMALNVCRLIVASIYLWSELLELNVPPYPETRVFRSITRHIRSYVEEPSEISLKIEDRPAS